MRIVLFVVCLLLIFQNIPAKDLPIRFYVANHKAECTGVTSGLCYLMRTSPTGEWKNYSNTIEGFKYEEGYEYEILVNKVVIENPPADASSVTYKLIEVVKKTPTMIITQTNRKILDNTTMYLTKIRTDHGLHSGSFADSYIKFDLKENRVSGKDGCNNISGGVTFNGKNISIGQLVSTRMLCEGVKVDKIFHSLIPKVNRYSIKGNRLRLYDGKKLLMEYSIPVE